MKFQIIPGARHEKGQLLYNADSFSFESTADCSSLNIISSVLINDLNLEIDDLGMVHLVSGLCPHTTWRETNLSPLIPEKGGLKIDAGSELIPGVSRRLNPKEKWPVHHNKQLGWVCVGDHNFQRVGIEFAPSCIAILDGDILKALWLLPEMAGRSLVGDSCV